MFTPSRKGEKEGRSWEESCGIRTLNGEENETRPENSNGLLGSTYRDGSKSLCEDRRSKVRWLQDSYKVYERCQTGATPSPVRDDRKGEGRGERVRGGEKVKGTRTALPIFFKTIPSQPIEWEKLLSWRASVISFRWSTWPVSKVKGQRGSFFFFSLWHARIKINCHEMWPLFTLTQGRVGVFFNSLDVRCLTIQRGCGDRSQDPTGPIIDRKIPQGLLTYCISCNSGIKPSRALTVD